MIVDKPLPWQVAVYEQLTKNSLPQTLLLYGPGGIGKWQFACAVAFGQLCQAPTAAKQACGECASCLWFKAGSHPDLHFLVSPQFAEQQHIYHSDDAVDNAAGNEEEGKKDKAASKEIMIDQVRALTQNIYLTPYTEQGRVVIVAPLDRLTTPAGNALLKVLEEPPPRTVFLLVANNLYGVLPTILSRCVKVAMPIPSVDSAQAWLQQQPISLPPHWTVPTLLALESHYPLALQNKLRALPEYIEFLTLCCHIFSAPAHTTMPMAQWFKVVPQITKQSVTFFVDMLYKWLFDLLCCVQLQKVHYFIAEKKVLETLAAKTTTTALSQAIQQLNDLKKVVEHPLSPVLFVEHLLLLYQNIFNPRSASGSPSIF